MKPELIPDGRGRFIVNSGGPQLIYLTVTKKAWVVRSDQRMIRTDKAGFPEAVEKLLKQEPVKKRKRKATR